MERALDEDRQEILLRLRDEDGRLVEPAVFLPTAERYGLTTRVDGWVVSRTFRWLSERVERGRENVTCFINLSGKSLGDDRFTELVLDQFERWEIDTESICFEITETSAIADMPNALRFMSTLRKTGCRFALDDFGSGLSSFAYLRTLPVDYLKIDGVFIHDLVNNQLDRALVNSINEIGHVMGKKTIAEHVESDAVLERLREMGVDFVQGFGVAYPQALSRL